MPFASTQYASVLPSNSISAIRCQDNQEICSFKGGKNIMCLITGN